MKHRKMAESCWRLIKALAPADDIGYADKIDVYLAAANMDATAIKLIEMACDSAAESQRIADGHPPKGAALETR